MEEKQLFVDSAAYERSMGRGNKNYKGYFWPIGKVPKRLQVVDRY